MYNQGLNWINRTRRHNSRHLAVLICLLLLVIWGDWLTPKNINHGGLELDLAADNDVTVVIGGNYYPSLPVRLPFLHHDIKELFFTSDLKVLGVTAPIGTSLPGKDPVIAPEIHYFLRDNEINVVQLADHRVLSAGVVGLLSTMDFLDTLQIQYTGAGLNAEAAFEPVYVTGKNSTVAVMSVQADAPPGWGAGNNRFGLAEASSALLAEKIAQVKKDSDLLIVVLAGCDRVSGTKVQELARGLIEQGANIVAGTGRGPVQRVETYRQGLIFYNIGVFAHPPAMFSNEKESVLLHVAVLPGGRVNITAIPLWVDSQKIVPAGDFYAYKIGKRLGGTEWQIDIEYAGGM